VFVKREKGEIVTFSEQGPDNLKGEYITTTTIIIKANL
jgi:hypothetical protein